MRTLLVFAHPRADSYNGTLAATVRRALERAGHEVMFTDLYREGFDPRLTPAEREHYYGQYNTAAVAAYVDALRRAEGVVFVFPHWWFSLPAILKGYFDRVWVPGVAFRHATDRRGHIEPMLVNLSKVWVVTTYGSPRWIVKWVMRNPTRRLFRLGLLRGCAPGASFRLLAHYDMDRATHESRRRFMAKVEKKLARF